MPLDPEAPAAPRRLGGGHWPSSSFCATPRLRIASSQSASNARLMSWYRSVPSYAPRGGCAGRN